MDQRDATTHHGAKAVPLERARSRGGGRSRIAYASGRGGEGDEMSILDRYRAYAEAFEESYLDDDW